MVLQRDRAAALYGFAPAGAWVNTTMTSGAAAFRLSTVAGADGVWRQALPAQPASAADGSNAWAFAVTSAAASASLEDVLFGDVHMCTGQSAWGAARARGGASVGHPHTRSSPTPPVRRQHAVFRGPGL